MSIEILRFKGAFEDEAPNLLEIEPEDIDIFVADEEIQLPAIYVVKTNDLDVLTAALEPEIEVRKKQNAGTGLNRYFGSKAHPVALIGKYQVPGKLRQAVLNYLQGADTSENLHMRLLGTGSDVFEKLKADSLEAPFNPLSPQEQMIDSIGNVKVPVHLRDAILGTSPRTRLLHTYVVKAASIEHPHRNPVIVLGETGTGKSLVARQIHDCRFGEGSNRPFVAVNCSAIPESLLESELFGAVKGAFTDSKADKTGRWEMANDGTLFLDEIGELQLGHQAKILQALEECVIYKVGGTKAIHVNAAVVAATNRDLRSLIDVGAFREDLYYRLNGMTLVTNPLREMGGDIVLLIEKLWRDQFHGTGGDAVLPQPVIEELKHFSWPGNVRQLKSTLHSLFLLYKKNVTYKKFAVFWHAEIDRNYTEQRARSEEHRLIESLHHLRRAREVVSGCLRVLDAVVANTDDRYARQDAMIMISNHLSELVRLCASPHLFGEVELSTNMQRVQEGVYRFSLKWEQNDPKVLADYWKDEQKPVLEATRDQVRDRIDRVVGGI